MVKRSSDVTYEVVDGQAVLVDPNGRELLTLNEVGTVVWQALDGTTEPAEIVHGLSAQFPDVDVAAIERDVAAFLDELRSSGLLEAED